MDWKAEIRKDVIRLDQKCCNCGDWLDKVRTGAGRGRWVCKKCQWIKRQALSAKHDGGLLDKK